jgi:hypothetical protein
MSKSYTYIELNGDWPEFTQVENAVDLRQQIDLTIGDNTVSLGFDSVDDCEVFCRKHNIEFVPAGDDHE